MKSVLYSCLVLVVGVSYISTQDHNEAQFSSVTTDNEGCGYSKLPMEIGVKIGDRSNEAGFGELPWMGALLENQTYKCGASLIHERVVLTAAHCLYKKDTTVLKVRLGEWDPQTTQERYPYQEIPVERVIIHPEFVKRNLVTNIALVILTRPVQKAPHIGTVCLPAQEQSSDTQTSCLISGWDKNAFDKMGKFQYILKKADLSMVQNNICQNKLNSTILGRSLKLNSFVCAGGVQDKETYKAEGGSPLVCLFANNRYYQTGLKGWPFGLENGFPGVYVNVAEFRDWIDSEMNNLNFGTDSYSPPKLNN